MKLEFLMGNEIIAHAALEAGISVAAGYPGTPSSEIIETIARLVKDGKAHGVHAEWSTNEKVALEVAAGASLCGKRALFTCKQVGLNVACDAIMSLNYIGVRGGLVLLVADDPGPISSQTEQDTRRFGAFSKVPVLDPKNPEQAFDMVKAAFELSEKYETPVIVRPSTRINHSSTFIEIEEETHAKPPFEDGFKRDLSKWVVLPRRAYAAHDEINERIPQIAHDFACDDTLAAFNPIAVSPHEDASPGFGILAGGVSAAYVLDALEIIKKKVNAASLELPAYRFMQVGTPYPFPDEKMEEFTKGLHDVFIFEELDYVLEDELARWAGRNAKRFNIHGQLTGETEGRGENSVDVIIAQLEKFLGLSGRLRMYMRNVKRSSNDLNTSRTIDNIPARPPILCAGCPHRGSFFAVKKALGKTPYVMCGDIGCYTLGNAQPLETIDTCLCMGAGITMAQGVAAADPEKKAIAFVGDSTYFASGLPGVANAAYNQHDITVMVLDNATTAMTGSQPHPGTGVTLVAGQSAPIDVEATLSSCGFKRIFHANPFDFNSSVVAVKAAVNFEGPSAVIFEAPCVQLVSPKKPAYVNTNMCTGCKKCIDSIGCPALHFDKNAQGLKSKDRGQVVIDQDLCVGCGLCSQICPFKAIVDQQ